MKLYICAIVLIATTTIGVFAAPGVLDNQIENSENDSFSRVAKFIGHCADTDDVGTCLAVKGITALNRAARSNNIEILPGITFTRDQSESVRSGKSLSENDILTELPKESEKKNGRLLDLALDSAIEFFRSHSLNIKVPQETTQDVARALEEGRKGGKMKKIMGPLMMAVGAKLIAMIPIFLGGLALLAIKAVVVAKIAFVMAILLGASKLFAGGAGGGILGKLGGGSGGGIGGYNNAGWNNGWQGGNAGWTAGGTGGYPYARSYDTQEAQDIAYRGQAPQVQPQQQ